ncbi:MAG: C1 family peptidase, partial [bacterium]
MRSLTIVIALLILLSAVFAAENPNPSAVDENLIAKMRDSFQPDATTQRLIDAVIKNPLKDIAVNNAVLRDHNPYFSHEIETGVITDQKSTGRCWLFAGLNILRPAVIDKIEDDSFEFSQSYLFFWDKIEKSNTFLEKVIARSKLEVRDQDFQRILRDPIGDGGWWEYFAYLVEKYGVVPQSAMPETKSTEHSGSMDGFLTEKLREYAAELYNLRKQGAAEQKLRAKKEQYLVDVYRILAFHLGEPPTQFSFRYKSKVDEEKKTEQLIKVMNAVTQGKSGADFADTEALKELSKEKVSVVKTYTPQEFAKEYVTAELGDYVVLGNDPSRELNRRYVIENDCNVFEQDWVGFINVGIADLKLAVLQSVLSDDPIWFGA